MAQPLLSDAYVAEVRLGTAQEMQQVLQRADELLLSLVADDPGFQAQAPIRFVLHGPEAAVFFRQNYLQNKALVDQAARLTSFGVVQVSVCETWMGKHRLNRADLQPFVGTVTNGPGTLRQMTERDGYSYF